MFCSAVLYFEEVQSWLCNRNQEGINSFISKLSNLITQTSLTLLVFKPLSIPPTPTPILVNAFSPASFLHSLLIGLIALLPHHYTVVNSRCSSRGTSACDEHFHKISLKWRHPVYFCSILWVVLHGLRNVVSFWITPHRYTENTEPALPLTLSAVDRKMWVKDIQISALFTKLLTKLIQKKLTRQ